MTKNQNALEMWRMRNVILEGKIIIFKAQVISKMVMKIKNKNRNNKKCFGPNKLKIKERNFIF